MSLNLGPHYWIVTSVSADSSLLFAHCCYGPNILHTTPMCGTEHIRCVSLHCRDQRGAATLRYRNRAKIIIYYLWTEAPSGIYGCGIALEIPMILQDPRKPTSAETSLKKWICVSSISSTLFQLTYFVKLESSLVFDKWVSSNNCYQNWKNWNSNFKQSFRRRSRRISRSLFLTYNSDGQRSARRRAVIFEHR